MAYINPKCESATESLQGYKATVNLTEPHVIQKALGLTEESKVAIYPMVAGG